MEAFTLSPGGRSRLGSPDTLEPAFEFARARVARGDTEWLVLAVSNAERTVRLEAFGAPGGEAARTDDAAPLFSVTKPMVAALAVRLWEQGRFGMHEAVASHVPGFDTNGKAGVLMRHLLTHSSGLSDAPFLEAARAGLAKTRVEQAVVGSPLLDPPGSKLKYSNAAFVALGLALETIGGAPLRVLLSRHVLEPLGMTTTGFDATAWARRVHTVPNFEGLGLSPTLEHFATLDLAAAGLWGTAEDLLAFGRAFLRGGRGNAGRFLSPAGIAAMLVPQTPDLPEAVVGDFVGWRMGLGWYLPSAPSGKLVTREGGMHSGAGGCLLYVSPVSDVTVAVLASRIRFRSEPLLNAVLSRLIPAD